MNWTVPDQRGRLAVITGGNAGLGAEIARRLAAAGADVVLACRNASKAEQAAAVIRRREPDARVTVASLDLADLSSVRKFSESFAAEHDRLDLLVNNAGLMAIDQAVTADGFEMQFGVNHLGHFALTNRLLPLLRPTPGSRVATMSSLGHRGGRMDFDDVQSTQRYRRWEAYFQSKLANLLFTAALQRRLTASDADTIAVAAHPGFTRTGLGKQGSSLSNRAMSVVAPAFTQSVVGGAEPMLRAATDPAATGGQYYGPRFIARGRPVLETPSRRARDAAAADRLWTMSAELTGLDAFG